MNSSTMHMKDRDKVADWPDRGVDVECLSREQAQLACLL